jgi:broad specificity phosphatase PhoE
VLIVVRHGQTAANAAGRLLGRADPPLTETGLEQATALAAALGPVDRVISSPLLRARQTAAALGQPVEVDERWTELDYGIYDGRPPAEVPAELWDRWRTDPDYTPPEGESLAALGRRVRAACEDVAAAAAGSDIVVVTHVSPIKAAVAWALGVGDEVAWRMFVGLASITRLGVGERGAVLRSFNEVAHLGQGG